MESVRILEKYSADEIFGGSCPKEIKELLTERDMLQAVFSSIVDAVYFTDLERRVIAWNPAAEALTGYTRDEAVGRSCMDFLSHTDDKGNVLCHTHCVLKRVLEGNCDGNCHVNEVWLNTKDGRRIPVEVSCSVVKNFEGNPLGAVEVFRDRTRFKELEKLKEDFISSITHDLKSPIASIMGFADLLVDPEFGGISDDKLSFSNNIRRASALLLSMVSNLVDVPRLTSGKMNYNFEKFELKKLFDDIIDVFGSLTTKKNISLTFSCPDSAVVYGDRERVRRIFYNLLSNSLRYTPKGGIIKVEAAFNTRGDRVMITLSDNGKGIPLNEQPGIFDRFSQVSGDYAGTGLGLYIVKQFLLGHGSHVRLVSAPGEGTSFIFSLPVSSASLPDIEKVEPEAKLSEGEDPVNSEKLSEIKKKHFILITCKDKTPAEEAFARAGYTFKKVDSGLEALHILHSESFDGIVVCDQPVDLLVEDFLESVRMTPEGENIPLLVVTARNSPRIKRIASLIFHLSMESDEILKRVEEFFSNRA